jgi:hypothetical protein
MMHCEATEAGRAGPMGPTGHGKNGGQPGLPGLPGLCNFLSGFHTISQSANPPISKPTLASLEILERLESLKILTGLVLARVPGHRQFMHPEPGLAWQSSQDHALRHACSCLHRGWLRERLTSLRVSRRMRPASTKLIVWLAALFPLLFAPTARGCGHGWILLSTE